MHKAFLRAFIGAAICLVTCCFNFQTKACDVQLGRPNSCNQYCDGDFINGPEIISCADYIQQKRGAAVRAQKARDDEIARRNAEIERKRVEQKQADDARAARDALQRKQADDARIAGEIQAAKRAKDAQDAKDDQEKKRVQAARDAQLELERQRQSELEHARQKEEIRKQQLENDRIAAEQKEKADAKRKEQLPSVGTSLSLVFILAIIGINAFLKRDHKVASILTNVGVPALTIAVKYLFGYDLKSEVTLIDIPLFLPAFGGVVAAYLVYKSA